MPSETMISWTARSTCERDTTGRSQPSSHRFSAQGQERTHCSYLLLHDGDPSSDEIQTPLMRVMKHEGVSFGRWSVREAFAGDVLFEHSFPLLRERDAFWNGELRVDPLKAEVHGDERWIRSRITVPKRQAARVSVSSDKTADTSRRVLTWMRWRRPLLPSP